MTHFIPVRSYLVPFTHRHTHTYTKFYLHSHICMHAQTLFLSNTCRSFAHSHSICAGGRTPGARLSTPEGWGGDKVPHHYIRGKDATFSRKWDMTNPRFTRTFTDWRSVTTRCNYSVLHWYLKYPAGKLRSFHCVPKSWHIPPAIHFSNCHPETTAGLQDIRKLF